MKNAQPFGARLGRVDGRPTKEDSGAGKPLCCGGGTRTQLGEAPPYFSYGVLQGKDFPGDQLVVVVGADRVPVDPVSGDSHFGDQRLEGQLDAVVGHPAVREGADDLVLGGDAE